MFYKKIEIKVDGYEETADLYTYILDNSVEMHPQKMRPVIVICPGGGYAMTSDREVGNLMDIRDHYPKYVVTLNEMDTGIENGIKIVHLADFLLAEAW